MEINYTKRYFNMYLDANFFVIATIAEDEKGVRARAIANEIIKGKLAITSSLTIDEVMWVLLKKQFKHDIRPIVEEIYGMKNLEIKEVPAGIPLRALDFMEKHDLKPRDAFHLAIMEHFGVKEIVSDDADFDDIPGIKRIKI